MPNWRPTKFRWTSADRKDGMMAAQGYEGETYVVNGKTRESTSRDSVDESSDSGQSNGGRGHWGNQLDFLLSCIGYAVGLGNIWRFPYLCMRNGGGAFLIPYFLFLFLCGMPLFFMELSLGQFSSCSPISLWELCPLFKGLGYGMILVSGIVCVYYNIIITWVLYYLGMSFTTDVLPWSTCDNSWNTENCIDRYGTRKGGNLTALNGTQYSWTTTGHSVGGGLIDGSATSNLTEALGNETKGKTAAEEFWQYNVLGLSDGIHNPMEIKLDLLLCLAVSWLIVFICLFKGIKSSGKVVYVTATAPYVFLIILFVRGLMLPGSLDGIAFYITPKWSSLLNLRVWSDACLQIFYSLGPAWGGLITMSSYNKFHNNVYRDAIIVPLTNCLTSFFGGFVIFAVLGFMAHEAHTTVDKVVTQGPGLAFIAYPEALTKLPISPFWAILFFLMLLTIGLDSQFGMFETLVSGFCDEFPQFFKGKKTLFTGVLCVVELLLGLPLVTRAGMYIFQILDWYCAAFSVILISICECIAVGWLYGAKRLYSDIELMIGYKPNPWWMTCWMVITPIILGGILVLSIFDHTQPQYGDYTYPGWAIGIGWAIASISMVPIPVFMVVQMARASGTFAQRLQQCITPSAKWGPIEEKYREQYELKWRNQQVDTPVTNGQYELTHSGCKV